MKYICYDKLSRPQVIITLCVGAVGSIHVVHLYVTCEDALNIAFVREITKLDDTLKLFD